MDPSKLFEIIQIATTLITHAYQDVDAGDPLVEDITTAYNSLKAAVDKHPEAEVGQVALKS